MHLFKSSLWVTLCRQDKGYYPSVLRWKNGTWCPGWTQRSFVVLTFFLRVFSNDLAVLKFYIIVFQELLWALPMGGCLPPTQAINSWEFSRMFENHPGAPADKPASMFSEKEKNAWVTPLSPIWLVTGFHWTGVWPIAWVCVTVWATQERMWNLLSVKHLYALPSEQAHLEIFAFRDAMKIKCVLFISPCAPPSNLPKKKMASSKCK